MNFGLPSESYRYSLFLSWNWYKKEVLRCS